MKFTKIKIISHPRAGSHYFAQLIDINFYDGTNYLRHYGGHVSVTPNYIKANPSIAAFYIWRNTEDTVKSIFNMRRRFGLDENSFDEFKKRTLMDMYNTNLSVNILVNNAHAKRIETSVDGLFAKQNMTVIQYIEQHQEKWMNYSKIYSNLMIICYDDLLNNFNDSMLSVGKFIGSTKMNFINTTEKVGWVPQDVEPT